MSGSVEGTPTHLLRVEYFQWGGEQAKCIAQGLAHTVLLRPWDSPGKNTGVGCHFCLDWS